MFALINAKASTQSLTDNLALYTPTTDLYTKTYIDALALTLNGYITTNTTAIANRYTKTDALNVLTTSSFTGDMTTSNIATNGSITVTGNIYRPLEILSQLIYILRLPCKH